ncbi:DapH/DapD/GlmU-related protein, partial [Salmonella enterica subsp. enterica serovar Lubbock]|nr:DapH/DapD/GlmU-related protein [Salmonella enterica subsp. enterica serovar Lubbock]
EDDFIIIGNNVDIGANTCIIGSITIGDNVTIGAMSFVNISHSLYRVRCHARGFPDVHAARWSL